MLYVKLGHLIFLFIDPYFYWGLALVLGILLEIYRQLCKKKEETPD